MDTSAEDDRSRGDAPNPPQTTPVVPKPVPAGNETIWRYMGLEKFLWMIHSSAVYFPSIANLDDRLDGATPLGTVNERDRLGVAGDPEAYRILGPALRGHVFVSCWCEANAESAGMWRAYLGRSFGVAIKSTVAQALAAIRPAPPIFVPPPLDPATQESVMLCQRVTYIDYAREHYVPTDASERYFRSQEYDAKDLLQRFFFKRLSFAYENEVRLAFHAHSSHYADPEYGNYYPSADVPRGLACQADLARLVDSVHVQPSAPDWYLESVRKAVASVNLDVPVGRSSMDGDPLFY